MAEKLGGSVISVDSMQVYRGMDIGTAKPTVLDRRGVPHHLIDIAEPEDEFSVAEFRMLGRRILEAAETPTVITGGSGLHFRALVDPMSFAPTERRLRDELESTSIDDLVGELLVADPEAGSTVDLANHRRLVRAVEVLRLTGETPSGRAASAEAEDLRRYVPEIEFTAVGVDPGDLVDARVDRRLGEMRSGGFLDEVRGLKDRLGRTAREGAGYRQLLSHLDGEITEDDAFDKAARKTRKLAKKQRTWFQRDPRIRWIPWTEDEDDRTQRVLEALR